MQAKQGVNELLLSMLPSRGQALDFEGELKLDDNLSDSAPHFPDGTDFEEYPMRVSFLMLLLCRQGSFRMRVNLEEFVVRDNEMLIILPGNILDRVSVEPGSRQVFIGHTRGMLQGHRYEPFAMRYISDYKGMPWLLSFTPEEADSLVDVYGQVMRGGRRGEASGSMLCGAGVRGAAARTVNHSPS